MFSTFPILVTFGVLCFFLLKTQINHTKAVFFSIYLELKNEFQVQLWNTQVQVPVQGNNGGALYETTFEKYELPWKIAVHLVRPCVKIEFNIK